MRNVPLIILFACFIAALSCNNQTVYSSKPFFDSYGKKVGDTVFYDNLIKKIVFTDSSYQIDSVVFSRYDSPDKTVKSVNTFMNGKHVFENVDYYQNGKIAKYKFLDKEKSNIFYERLYSSSGRLLQTWGNVFFQGYLVDTMAINEEKLKKGTSTAFRVFYPNPPDCIASVYVMDEDTGEKYDVFQKSSFLNFLQTTWQDNQSSGYFKTTVLLELFDKHADTTIKYSQTVFFEVASNER